MSARSLSRVLPATLPNLAALRKFIREAIEQFELKIATEIVDDLIFSANEIATNIIRHGYQDSPGVIEVEVSYTGEAILIRLCDSCSHFDPNSAPTPNLSLPLEQRPLGKVGLYLTQDYMDEVQHRPLEPQGNEITLVKYLEKE